MIHASLACNLESQVLLAALPLFESGKVDAIEWSFDTLYKTRNIPAWYTDLIQFFSDEKRLVAHGVYFSLFKATWTPDQQFWLDHLQQRSQYFNFDHVSEHFGFMTGEDFHKGAPMTIPFTKTTLEIGRDRLKRIYHSCHRPVGIENLAFAYSLDEVKMHGEFLDALVEPVNGFLILDLHNLYCQSQNFTIHADLLISIFPLSRVREIHISGGSWEPSAIQAGRQIRRDTHDEAVPEEVFQLLKYVLPLCPHLKYVVFEHLEAGLQKEAQHIQFRNDFERMREIVYQFEGIPNSIQQNTFLPDSEPVISEPIIDDDLHEQQNTLTMILENAEGFDDAVRQLQNSVLVDSSWKIERWDPSMLETAIRIAQKWKG